MDIAGSDRGLFWGNVLALAWRDTDRPLKQEMQIYSVWTQLYFADKTSHMFRLITVAVIRLITKI
jgi:hypothetical protein